MHSPLLSSFIFICKLIICISLFLSVNTHHWIRNTSGERYKGLEWSCYDYGHSCYKVEKIERGIWFFYIITLLNVILELLNILILYKRTRSRINLILEEITVLITLIFLIVGTLIIIVVFILVRKNDEIIDWSFIIFFLAVVLAFIDLICSLVRVVSYCRDHSFRSNNIVTYTSNNNHETIQIQS